MSTLRVRMYRQGLGDCFLLSFSGGSALRRKTTHVLIDCGVLKGTDDAATKMTAVAENVREATGGRLDVLVSTHEHWDHLSGFLQAEDVFDTLAVSEVWLAWTEDPEDELAAELRGQKARAVEAVTAATQRLADDAQRLAPEDAKSAQRSAEHLDALLGFHGELGLAGGKTTAAALEWVKSRRGAKVRYLRPGELTAMPGVPDVRVYVLGPPHDRASIKRSDPHKKDSEVYELAADLLGGRGFRAALGTLGAGVESDMQPFADRFRIDEAEAKAEPFFRDGYYGEGDEWRTVEHDWLTAASSLALHLDSDTNNTSLVLAFELPGGEVLLFPGDAQVGNWLSWETLSWPVGSGESARTVTSTDLLARTVLYKVGHHGSHNATLRAKGLELMTSADLTAMVPVNRETAKKMDWNMPFPSLFDRLQERTRGRILDAERGLAKPAPGRIGEEEWSRFEARVHVEPNEAGRTGWIDYRLEW